MIVDITAKLINNIIQRYDGIQFASDIIQHISRCNLQAAVTQLALNVLNRADLLQRYSMFSKNFDSKKNFLYLTSHSHCHTKLVISTHTHRDSMSIFIIYGVISKIICEFANRKLPILSANHSILTELIIVMVLNTDLSSVNSVRIPAWHMKSNVVTSSFSYLVRVNTNSPYKTRLQVQDAAAARPVWQRIAGRRN